uniref:Uncharacterized protein n=1 Tax=Anguilla anguilla TaxID=7936 RepID=A0A0E9PLT9_ANGAN
MRQPLLRDGFPFAAQTPGDKELVALFESPILVIYVWRIHTGHSICSL